MSINHNRVNFLKKSLIENVKKISKEKKDRLNIQSIHFEKEDIDDILDGTVKLGYYLHVKDPITGVIRYKHWEDVPAMTLVKVRDILIKNRFYGEKYVQGEECKVRLKK